MDVYDEIVLSPGENSIELAPPAPGNQGHIRISVTGGGAARAPVPGVGLCLLDPVDSPLGLAGNTGFFSYSGVEGVILLENLAPGRYGISLSEPEGRGYLFDARVLVKPGHVSEVEVVIEENMEDE